jgi:N-dimethylarginine dimethylaminohydrolase
MPERRDAGSGLGSDGSGADILGQPAYAGGVGAGPADTAFRGRFAALQVPVFLMNLPLSLSADVPNNIWMEKISVGDREIWFDKAMAQFLTLYRHIAARSVVYLLPSTPGLQDQTYVSNLGCVLPHCEQDTIIISRFRSKPRIGEARIGVKFFKLMNFRVELPPDSLEAEPLYFEGEADLKHIRDNLYIGAYGMRTSRNALHWAAERFAMNILPFRIDDPHLYHLDGNVFRITEQAVLVCTSVADPRCIREIEKHCEIIDVSLEHARAGITNNALVAGEVLCDSEISELGRDNELYEVEKTKIACLDRICSRLGRSLQVFCMSEFYKSGALLSCLVMPIRQLRN